MEAPLKKLFELNLDNSTFIFTQQIIINVYLLFIHMTAIVSIIGIITNSFKYANQAFIKHYLTISSKYFFATLSSVKISAVIIALFDITLL